MGLNTAELKAARVRRGLTQKDVAKALNTAVSNYAGKENGKTNMSLVEVNIITKLMSLTPREIQTIFLQTNFT